ncbi:MerR family transcriptional regulator [Amycolatopsis sp. CA-128772]|uniref:helix-turn-helix domain-containing protein n=1 Tax=Amycolatopsis sp. CA-128772 TaxID=2073159 RepID=UPI001E402762|nr:MerR family transcriptional regulator [Amycolatopsis sp. CA-128772]
MDKSSPEGTVHHYDRIGLVPPAERTPAGHRRYAEADVRRLHRVRTLSWLGLSLARWPPCCGTRARTSAPCAAC